MMNFDSSMIGAEGGDQGGEIRRFMFAVELNGTVGTKTEDDKTSEKSDSFSWKPETACSGYKDNPAESESLDGYRQTLILRRVILGPTAKAGESNWVSVEVTDPEGRDTKFPVAHLSKGTETQTMVDIAFPDPRDVTIKFTLEEGTGPVHIIGYHLLERLQFEQQDEECEEEDVEDEGDVIEENEGEVKELKIQIPTLRAKRRINGENGNGDAQPKKIKTNNGDEPMEETNGEAKK